MSKFFESCSDEEGPYTICYFSLELPCHDVKLDLIYLKTIPSEVQKIIDEGKAAAEKVKEEIIYQARQDAEAIVEKAKSDSEAEKERLSSEISSQVADLSLAISQKVAASMSEKDQQDLIDKFIKDMETSS